MSMDQYPEVKQAIQAYILRESVVRLHDEEIVQKVQLTEKDIIDYYKKNYESLTLDIIEFNSEEEAKEQLELLKKGDNFTGREIVLNRYSVTPQIEKAISNLKPGEISDVMKTQHKYYILKLIDKKEAPDEELERVRGSIEKAIRKRKERERSDEYLKYLRERSRLKVDSELLSTIRLDGEKEEKENLSKDAGVIAEVNGSILTVKDFISLVTSTTTRSKEEILDNWIDRKIVDQEALSRHYEMKADLGNIVNRYKNQLLKNTFIKRVIAPQVTISEEALKDYYLNHQKKFTRSDSFKIQQITVKTLDKAQDILDNLQKGADFSWLAKRWSVDTSAENGGEMGWLTESDMPKPVKEIVVTLKPGDVSPIIEIGSLYSIIRLQGRKEGEVEEFDKVKDAVYRACFEDQLNTILNKYVSQLKKDSEIKINDKAVGIS
jgi:parvulin-like peptidyl-prolyl isomerase